MFKTVNIKECLPNCEYAIFQAYREIECSNREGVDVLIIVHGYGSSGVGGKIKNELHKFLSQLLHDKKIISFIPGEKWADINEDVLKIIKKYPNLAVNSELRNLNSGITVVNISLN